MYNQNTVYTMLRADMQLQYCLHNIEGRYALKISFTQFLRQIHYHNISYKISMAGVSFTHFLVHIHYDNIVYTILRADMQ